MEFFSALNPYPQPQTKSRSMGLKLIIVCFLALLMAIPALFVGGLVDERTKRASDVAKEISSYVGGPQTFLGPTLAVPYTIRPVDPTEHSKQGVYLVFPAKAVAAIKTATEERHRSLFKVPVFKADLKLDSSFDFDGTSLASSPGMEFDWSRAEIVVGVSDARGALSDATLTTNSGTVSLNPSQITDNLAVGSEQSGGVNKLILFGAKAGLTGVPAKFNVSAALKFSGAERIAVLPYGKTTQLTAQGDWPNPGFNGGTLPNNRTISANGYTAEWSVPFIARGVRASGPVEYMTGLNANALGISFIEVADTYQCVTRSLKYILLFLGLLFLTYFTFEVTTGKRVHPAQYVLVGLAQTIFYLLLLSFAERIGFDYAFLLAGTATVLLLSANATWIFASRLQGVRAFIVFSLLYVFTYFLMRLEDNALMIGAVASFLAVAAVMYFTRKIDWYSSQSGIDFRSGTLPPAQAKAI